MSEWQPIETAPKDGTALLAIDALCEDCSVVKWDTLRRCWIAMGDGHLAISSQGDTWCDYIEPWVTHWMPNPPPPPARPKAGFGA